MNKTMRILSIDAWADEYPKTWSWNNWFHVGDFPSELIDKSNRTIIKWMRDNGFLSEQSKGKVTINDDQYNIVVIDNKSLMPLFAIEYGREQEEEDNDLNEASKLQFKEGE